MLHPKKLFLWQKILATKWFITKENNNNNKHAVKNVIKTCHFSESSNQTRQTWRAVPRKIHNQETSGSLILMTKVWEVRVGSQISKRIVVTNWQKCLKISKNSCILTSSFLQFPVNLRSIRPNFSGSHTFSLTATAKILFLSRLAAGMLFLKRNENRARSQV